MPLILTQDDVESEKGLTAKLSGANEKALPSVLTDCETRPYRQISVSHPVSIVHDKALPPILIDSETRPYRQDSVLHPVSIVRRKALSPMFEGQ